MSHLCFQNSPKDDDEFDSEGEDSDGEAPQAGGDWDDIDASEAAKKAIMLYDFAGMCGVEGGG